MYLTNYPFTILYNILYFCFLPAAIEIFVLRNFLSYLIILPNYPGLSYYPFLLP